MISYCTGPLGSGGWGYLHVVDDEGGVVEQLLDSVVVESHAGVDGAKLSFPSSLTTRRNKLERLKVASFFQAKLMYALEK